MIHESPFLAMQRAETQLKILLRGVDTDMLTPDEKKALSSLKRLSGDARIDIRDYELSETREEQLVKAKDARRRLGRLKSNIVAASMVFGAADVAQLDAQLDQIMGNIV